MNNTITINGLTDSVSILEVNSNTEKEFVRPEDVIYNINEPFSLEIQDLFCDNTEGVIEL